MNACAHISLSRHARNSLALPGIMVRCFIAAVTAVIIVSCSRHEDNKVPNGELAEDIRRADSLVATHDFPEALRALKAFSSVQNPPTTDTAMLVKAYSLMAGIHSKYEDYSSQQTFLVATEKLLPASSPTLPPVYSQLVDCSCRLGDKAASMSYLSLQKNETDTASPEGRYYMKYSDGIFDLAYRSEEDGILKLRDAQALSADLGLKDSERADLLLHLADAYMHTGKPDSAILYVRALENTGKPLDHKQNRELLQSAAAAFSMKGDSANATAYARRWVEHDDSLNSSVEFLSVNSMLNSEHAHRRHADIDLLSSNLGLWRALLSLLIAAVFAAMGIEFLKIHRAKKQCAITAEPESEATDNDTRRNEILDDIYKRIITEISKPENYTRPDYNLNLLATEVGANVSYVSKAINVNGGKNFRSLLNEYRIREACQRLSDADRYGHLTLQAIAESVGFVSASSFIRAFKQVTGTTPSNYKKTGETTTLAEY